jgi:hypothetical protein
MARICQWKSIVTIFLGCLLLASKEGPAMAAIDSACAELHKKKATIYGFRPSEISKEERKDKSARMDEFWKSVKAHGQPGLECLRQLITTEQQDGFFVFDAASLLISLDQSPASLEVARIGISKTNLKDVDSSGYIRNTLFLFHKGLDITPLVEHYMTAPEVKGFVPQHAMKLDRETGAFFLYGSMSSASADQSLIRMLNSKEPSTRSAAAVLLSLNLTKESFKALKTVNRTSLPEPTRQAVESAMKYQRIEKSGSAKKSRAEVMHTLSRIPKYGEDFYGVAGDEEFAESAIAFLQEEDLPALREARRKSIYGLSDEALGEYFALSRVLLGVINRLDLYRDVREH